MKWKALNTFNTLLELYVQKLTPISKRNYDYYFNISEILFD